MTIPTLKFELEGARQTLVTAIGAMNDDIEKAVDAELAAFIENYDFAEAIRQHMEPILIAAIGSALKHHFEWGAGKKTIDDAVIAALKTEK